jgi:hypothetical protein
MLPVLNKAEDGLGVTIVTAIEERSRTRVGDRRQASGIGHVLVALALGRLDDRLAGIGAVRDRGREAVATAPQEHVNLVVDLLLGD